MKLRHRNLCILSCLITALSSAINAQTISDSPASDRVHLQAIVSNLGWPSSPAHQDLLAKGTLTRDGASEPITLKVQPGGKMRTELPTTGTVVVVNDAQGYVSNNGTIRHLAAHEAIAMRAWMFPIFTELGDLSAADVSANNDANGSDQIFEVSRHHNESAGFQPHRDRFSKIKLHVSAGAVSAVEFERPSHDNQTATVKVMLLLSDFRGVAGVQLPFRVEEQVQGNSHFVMQFDSIQINANIANSDFEIPASSPTEGRQ